MGDTYSLLIVTQSQPAMQTIVLPWIQIKQLITVGESNLILTNLGYYS